MSTQAGRAALVLASGSPRRRALLVDLGASFTATAVVVDEGALPGEPAPDYVLRVATKKAYAARASHADSWILAADTSVEIDGLILGKPNDVDAARAMLGRLSGRTHRVLTAVVLLAPGGRVEVDEVVTAEVRFRPLAAEEIERYVASAEPFDKAGGYGVQGAARHFVEEVTGSYTAVVGLPMELVESALRSRGLLAATPTGRGGQTTGAGAT
jgi:septum formation protein